MRQFPDPNPAPPDHRSPLRYLVWLAGRHRASIVLATVYGIFCTLAQGLVPAAVGEGIDAGLIAKDRTALVQWGVVILALGVTQAITGTLRDRSSITNRFGANYLTMQFVTRQASRLGATLTKRVSAGEVVNIGATDITRIGGALEGTARGSGGVVSILVVAAIMLVESWRLGLVVLIGVPLMAWAIAKFMRLLHDRQHELRNQQTGLTNLSMDIVEGLRVLRGIGGEGVFADRYRVSSQRMRQQAVRVAAVQAWVGGVKILLPGLLITAIVWLGAIYVEAGQISAGLLVSFYGFSVFLSEQLRRVTTMVDQLTRALVSARRVVDLLGLRPELTSRPRAGVELPTAATLTDPESGLTVPPDRFVGVVCTSSADVDRLADRLAWYTDSTVSYGGVPPSELPRDQVRRRILLVDTESRLFSGPLRSELDPYDRAASDEALLWRAIDHACARDIIDPLPEGIDGRIVGGGREFSGGQQQRLRLVRALMADPDVLILVEPTNALDAHTEGRIAQQLKEHRSGKTTVVFSTSPIVLDHADNVVLVDDGKVVASGTHEDLLADTRYRNVVTREVVTT